MTSNKAWDERVMQYEKSHQHPLNRLFHLVGIPLITLSILLLPAVLFVPEFWPVLLIIFTAGWLFQFAGHLFEGKPPKFFHDWRYLFVGLHWWITRVSRRNKNIQ